MRMGNQSLSSLISRIVLPGQSASFELAGRKTDKMYESHPAPFKFSITPRGQHVQELLDMTAWQNLLKYVCRRRHAIDTVLKIQVGINLMIIIRYSQNSPYLFWRHLGRAALRMIMWPRNPTTSHDFGSCARQLKQEKLDAAKRRSNCKTIRHVWFQLSYESLFPILMSN